MSKHTQVKLTNYRKRHRLLRAEIEALKANAVLLTAERDQAGLTLACLALSCDNLLSAYGQHIACNYMACGDDQSATSEELEHAIKLIRDHIFPSNKDS